MTRLALAQALGLPLGLIERYEQGLADPSNLLARIGVATSTSVEWLVGRDGGALAAPSDAARLFEQIADLCSELSGERRRLAEEQALLDQEEAEIERWAADVDHRAAKLEDEAARLTQARETLERTQEEGAARDATREAAERSISSRVAEVVQAETRIAERIQRADEQARAAERLVATARQRETNLQRLEAELAARETQLQDAERLSTETATEVARIQEELARRARELEAAEAGAARRDEQFAAREVYVAEVDEREAVLSARAEQLAQSERRAAAAEERLREESDAVAGVVHEIADQRAALTRDREALAADREELESQRDENVKEQDRLAQLGLFLEGQAARIAEMESPAADREAATAPTPAAADQVLERSEEQRVVAPELQEEQLVTERDGLDQESASLEAGRRELARGRATTKQAQERLEAERQSLNELVADVGRVRTTLPELSAWGQRVARVPRAVPPAAEHERAAHSDAAETRANQGSCSVDFLERLVDTAAADFPRRADEWRSYVFYLREFAEPTGLLPASFDALVWDVFGPLLERRDLAEAAVAGPEPTTGAGPPAGSC